MIIYSDKDKKLLEVEVDDNSYRHRVIMGDYNLTLYYSLADHVELPVGCYCEFQGERFTLERPEAFKMKHSRSFEYTVTMESSQAKAKIWKFRNPVDGRLKFSLTAKPHEHLQMFVDNMNRRDTGWAVGSCVSGDEVCISYNHAFCYEALSQAASTLNTEFEFNGKTVSLRKVEYNKNNPLPLSYGRGNGFKPNVGRSNYGDTPPTEILYVQGGSDNIDPSKYGSSELLLPKSQSIAFDGVYFENEEGFNAKNARHYTTDDLGFSIRRTDKALTSLAESSLDCSDIYPKRVGEISSVVCVDKDKHFYDIIDNSIPENLDYEKCLIDGETMTVIFQTGMLAGKEFEVKYYHNSILNPDGSLKSAARRFEITPQEIDGQTMPNETFCPRADDKYAVFKCMLPDAYICDNATKSGASWDMFRQAVKSLFDSEETKFTFTGELDGIWAKKDWLNIGGRIKLGGYIKFSDERFQKDGVLVRITGIKDYINKPHSPSLELSNETIGTSFSTKLKELESEEVVIEDNHREALQFTKRRFRDAKETMSMLEASLLENFTQSINPIAIQTMQMLVGDESLQFRFVSSKTQPTQVSHTITYNQEAKTLKAAAGIIQHMTLGVSSLSSSHKPDEYMYWDVEEFESARIEDGSKKYYLYAKVSKTADKGVFFLSESAKTLNGMDGFYCLLVGVLNSEYNGERSFATLYGFTEVLPGRVTTDRVVSGDGNSYFDMLANKMKLGDALDFNSAGDGKLKLKGTIVQSQSGQESYIGCYRGEYNASYTYYNGDEVSFTKDGNTSTYRMLSDTPVKGVEPSNSLYWQVIAQGSKGLDGEKGADGQDGAAGQYTELRYAKNGSTTTPPTLSKSSLNPSGWSTSVPSVGNLEYLWQTSAVKTGDGQALVSQWSTPVRITPYNGQDGKNGSSPASVFCGIYSDTKIYYGNSIRIDVVKYNSEYFVARTDAPQGTGGFKGVLPTNTDYWNTFGASYESVATQLLLAENANIGNMVIKDNCIISQKGTIKGEPSIDYENSNFVPNILLDGANGQSIISGSLRSPCARYDGSVYLNSSFSNKAEIYDNLVLSEPQGSWGLSLDFPWSNKCNGRKITIINYKWGNEMPNGTYTINAPDGKYFFENGDFKKNLKMNREVVELLGYGDDKTFFGWVVIGRCSIGTDYKYGKPLKALAYGTVSGTPSGASISYKTYDGKSSMIVSRIAEGRYRITFPSEWFDTESNVFVMATGLGYAYGYPDASIKATVVERNTSYITIDTSDDESRNDGMFMFLLMNFNDWL